MIRPESLTILALLALAGPAMAATPSRPASPPKTATPSVSDSDRLIGEAHDAAAKGNSQLAERLAQSAIVADPSQPAAYVALGDVYASAGQPDFARDSYQRALDIDPSDADAGKAMAALDRAADTRKADAGAGAKPGSP
jgi:Tfp pilus assembly protein PilF